MDSSFQGREQKQEVEIRGNPSTCLEGDYLIIHNRLYN